MKLEREKALDLMVALTFDRGLNGKKPSEELARRISDSARADPESIKFAPGTSPDLKELFVEVQEAVEREEGIEVEGEGPEEASSPKKGKKKVTKTKEATPKKEGKKPAKAKAPTSNAHAESNGSAKRPGRPKSGEPTILGRMLDLLKRASEKKPITKAQIHETLVEEFPERKPDSLKVYVASQVPTRLVKGIEGAKVESKETKEGSKGYWLAK
jgi:hypothetical protein